MSHVRRPNLWHVGFKATSLELIRFMSGLVEIVEVVWIEKDQALILIVQDKDRTKTIFRTGGLAGTPIPAYRSPGQPLAVPSNHAVRTSPYTA